MDVTLRLKILEIIELRSLGWNSNPGLESFYQEKVSMFEKKESSPVEKPASPVASVGDVINSQSQQSQLSEPAAVDPQFKERPRPGQQEREYLTVNLNGENVRLFLSSVSSHLTKHAKLVLSQHFASKSSSGSSIGAGVQYTREDLLSMARSPSVREKRNWDSILAHIPEIIRKP